MGEDHDNKPVEERPRVRYERPHELDDDRKEILRWLWDGVYREERERRHKEEEAGDGAETAGDA